MLSFLRRRVSAACLRFLMRLFMSLIWGHGSKGAREHGSTGAREHGSMGAWEHGRMGAREDGSMGGWGHGWEGDSGPSPQHLRTHPPTHSLTHSLTHPPTHSRFHLSTLQPFNPSVVPAFLPSTHLVLAHSDLFPLDGLHVQRLILLALAFFLVVVFLAFGRLDDPRTLACACRDPTPTAPTAPAATGQIQRAAVATVGIERAALAAVGLLCNRAGVERCGGGWGGRKGKRGYSGRRHRPILNEARTKTIELTGILYKILALLIV